MFGDDIDLLTRAFIAALVILSTAFHEMGHAFVATWLGDPTPGRHGRLTFNPIPHLQPVLTAIVLPLVTILSNYGFMILATTPVDPSRLRKPLRDQALVAVAGPIMNVVCAAVMLGILWIPGMWNVYPPKRIAVALAFGVDLNLILAVFNMLPLPPLDGSRILRILLPVRLRIQFDDIARSPYCWLVAIMAGSKLIEYVDGPIVHFVAKLLPH